MSLAKFRPRAGIACSFFLLCLVGACGHDISDTAADAAPATDARAQTADAHAGEPDADLPARFTLGGFIFGLSADDEVELTLNGGNTLTLAANDTFVFSQDLRDGDAYEVVVATQPSSLECVLSNASGTISGADVGNVIVDCDPAASIVGGTVTGLGNGESVDLSLNGSETITVAANEAFVFTTPLSDGFDYSVEVADESPTLDCNVTDGLGTIGIVDVSNVSVACVPSALLTGLLVSTVAPIAPPFDPGVFEYQVDASVLAQRVILTPTTADPNATILINGVAATSGDAHVVTLDLGVNDITVGVTAESGATESYSVRVERGVDVVSQVVYGKGSNPDADDHFGDLIAIDGDTLVVSAPGEDSNATGIGGDEMDNTAGNSGAVYVFRRNGATWAQEAYIKASNTEADDAFGRSVSLSGDTLVVGANLEDSGATGVDGDDTDNTEDNSGAVYVFSRSGTTWSQEAYLKASNTGSGDQFGALTALDGDTLVVGAHTEDSNATGIDGAQDNDLAPNSGAVYVFTRSGTTWTQEAYLKASNAEANDLFGGSIALSGNTLAVAAADERSTAVGINGDEGLNGATGAGAVYVFVRDNTTWSQQAYVKASTNGVNDSFGFGLALSGEVLAVGAPGERSNATGVGGAQDNNDAGDSGAVFVFTRSGTTWTQDAYIKASNTSAGDRFGQRLGLVGETLAIMAAGEDSAATGIDGDEGDDAADGAGAVYVFQRDGGTWAQDAYVKASNTEGADSFGADIWLSADTLAVGAPFEDSNASGIDGLQDNNDSLGSGAIYLFQ